MPSLPQSFELAKALEAGHEFIKESLKFSFYFLCSSPLHADVVKTLFPRLLFRRLLQALIPGSEQRATFWFLIVITTQMARWTFSGLASTRKLNGRGSWRIPKFPSAERSC